MSEHARASLCDFLDRVAEKEPTPGGGAAAALVGANGVALAEMALRYSLAAAPELETSLARLNASRAALVDLIDADCAAYAAVSVAYAMPRTSDEEREARRRAIQDACRGAMAVPLRGMGAASDALTVLHLVAPKINRNLQTDAATAALTLDAAVDSLGLFVLVNANVLGEDQDAHDARREEARLRDLAARASHDIRARVRTDLEDGAR